MEGSDITDDLLENIDDTTTRLAASSAVDMIETKAAIMMWIRSHSNRDASVVEVLNVDYVHAQNL